MKNSNNNNGNNKFLLEQVMTLVEKLASLKTSVDVSFKHFAVTLEEVGKELSKVSDEVGLYKADFEKYKTKLEFLEKELATLSSNFNKEINAVRKELVQFIKKPTKTTLKVIIVIIVCVILLVGLIAGVVNIREVVSLIISILKR